MEKQASLNVNMKSAVSSNIEKGAKIGKKVIDNLKTNTDTPIEKSFWRTINLRKFGLKACGAGFLVLVLIKPSVVENIFNAFDFSQRKKDRTETRTLKFPREDYGNLIQSIEGEGVSFDQITDDKAIYYTDLLKFERSFESDLNQTKLDLLEKIIEKQSKIKNFEKDMKTLSQDYFKESENFKKILKSIKKNDVGSEEYEKITVLLYLAESNSKSFFNNQKSNASNPKVSAEKIDLFAYAASKNLKYSESEISEFIGNLNNNEIIKQYYVVENLKSKINSSFNENIENNLNKCELEKTFKKYDAVAHNYTTNKKKFMDDYINNYKEIDQVQDTKQVELFYSNFPADLVNSYLTTFYEKYSNLFKELNKKVKKTNNVDNIIKFNHDNKEIISKFEKISFDFKDAFIQLALEKSKSSRVRIYSQIEIKNEFEKIKLELFDRIFRDLLRKSFGSFFINRFYNNIILPNYKEMSPLLYFWFDPKKPIDKSFSGYRAIGAIDHAIDQNDFERAFEILVYLKEHKDLTKDIERKLSYHIKSQLLFDVVSEHSNI